jgi:hypothetical protein
MERKQFQDSLLKFLGMSSSVRAAGWSLAMASSFTLAQAAQGLPTGLLTELVGKICQRWLREFADGDCTFLPKTDFAQLHQLPMKPGN